MSDFYNDLYRGKKGEQLVYDALTARKHTVIDLRNDSEARWNDIDFRVIQKSGNITTLEVKTDFKSESTGNFFIEYENRNNKKHKYYGWYRFCKAEWICFVQDNIRKAYLVSFDELKQLIKKNPFRVANGEDAVGFLVPVSRIEELPSCYCMEL